MRSPPLLVCAGRTLAVPRAFEALKAYASRHERTISQYDLALDPSPGQITEADIKRSRVISSRISNAQGEWFCAAGSTAPWSLLMKADQLADADPEVHGGLYDGAERFYFHFLCAEDRPWGVNVGKIHKVLHLKFPDLFPILDGTLRRRYSSLAREAAKASRRTDSHLFWAAIRKDLLASRNALPDLRSLLEGEPITAPLISLTDLRIIDALAWSVASGQHGVTGQR